MDNDTRFTLLPFPQFYDGGESLQVRIVVVPRNQNPLMPHPAPFGVVAFADANFSFEARIISGLSNFPYDQLTSVTRTVFMNAPTNARALFEALGKSFDIKPLNQDNSTPGPAAENLTPSSPSVMKYLPVSYREQFNFTTPRTPNAVTDDSYRCAVRNAKKVPGFKRSPDWITWGKVFAYALRHPQLAEHLGMIYDAEVTIENTDLANGGWLYFNLADDSDYHAIQQTHPVFVKRYAARIPALTVGQNRRIFAPILFPVLVKTGPADPDPDGNYDDVLIEAPEYDDGYAKIVHAFQPRSRDLLAEEGEGGPPVKDVGIRLGWDDEQILIWHMRQLTFDSSVKKDPSKRLDAPLGVFGYAIDVRDPRQAGNPWISLTAVKSKAELSIDNDGEPISIGEFEGELPYQVYPLQLDGDKSKSYWLPMYFASWNGHSMVLPDPHADDIYHTNDPTVQPDTEPTGNTSVTGPAKSKLNDIYNPLGLNIDLRYGRKYEFRVRLRDLSGGGVPLGAPFNGNSSNVGTCPFRRFVAPNQPRINRKDLPVGDVVTEITKLRIQRPLIGYPAALYIPDKYADPVARLIADSQAAIDEAITEEKGRDFGISDPDVDRVEVTVEVQTLRMDNLKSVSGKENYVHLYTTNCLFPPVNNEDDYDAELNLPIVYRDCPVLHTADEDKDLSADLGLPDDIEELDEIVVPTARTIRLTIRAVCEDKVNNDAYYGLTGDEDDLSHENDVRYGPLVQVLMYKESEDERDLFLDVPMVPRVQGIYLQPDPPQLFDGTTATLLLGTEVQKPPDMIERLADQLGLASRGLTLTGAKGERVQFGCSNRIRHTLAPENSSITFSSKGDLMNHWLCCISLQVNRDWTWDGLKDRAFVITREKRFTHDDPATETEREEELGDIEIRHTAPFEALEDSKRNFTRLVFIDAVEPKNPRLQPVPTPAPTPAPPPKPRFPDTIEVSYTIKTHFKDGHAALRDEEDEEQSCRLPITTPPSQVPRIVSAGIALSPYERNKKYSATQPRRRYLWVEFAEPVEDPNDTFFARMLAYAPDQLISDNRPELFVAPEEPPLPIDPEYIRSVRDGATNDLAGLRAMQPMKKATDSDRHYLLPLPKNLHANADEMFGFFTYEFRLGHYKDASTPEQHDFVWSTAQGRFGRRLRVTGIQHPAPTLTCMVDRDEEKLYVSAPYAVAVFKGKNVTADPPRTQLWCLLYAQVRQADNRDYRNILLDDKKLDWRVQIERERDVNWFIKYDIGDRQALKHLSIRNWKDELDYGKYKHLLKLTKTDRISSGGAKFGTAVWSNNEVSQLLALYGLPGKSPLSVLVVEFLPNITNYGEHFPPIAREEMTELLLRVREELFQGKSDLIDLRRGMFAAAPTPGQPFGARPNPFVPDPQEGPSPANEALGQRRILRTSPLTEVPYVC